MTLKSPHIASVLVVDDEPSGRKTLIGLIERYCPELNVLGEAGTVETAIGQIKALQPDLVFLDIELRPGTGFDILDYFNPVPFQVIFCTAFDQHALRAFKYAAVHYLCKPVDILELKEAVKRGTKPVLAFDQQVQLLQNSLRMHEINKIALPRRDGYFFAEVDKIVYLKADGSYTHFYFEDGSELLISKRIGHYENMLDSISFLRIHHTYIINLKFMVGFANTKNGSVTMTNQEEIPISRNRKAILLKRLQELGMV